LAPSAALVAALALALAGCGGGGGAGAAGGGSPACQKMPTIWKTFLAADHSDAIDAYNNLFGSISDLGVSGISNQQLNSDLYNLSAAANNLGGDYADNDGSGPAPADVTEFKTEAKAVSADCGISLALPSFG
jgi:hypothetical protein